MPKYINLRLTEEQHQAIKLKAELNHISMSEYIKRKANVYDLTNKQTGTPVPTQPQILFDE